MSIFNFNILTLSLLLIIAIELDSISIDENGCKIVACPIEIFKIE